MLGRVIQKKQVFTSRQIAFAAMFAALIFVATFAIKIPTPTQGYIHLGDVFVILAGITLGPVAGGLAAGIGASLSDLASGYTIWVPGTFVIKFLMAVVSAYLYRFVIKRLTAKGSSSLVPAVVIPGIAGELLMVVGYFFYKILVIVLTNGSFNGAGLMSAVTLSLAGVPFNIVEGVVSIIIAVPLLPLFLKLKDRAK